MIALSCSILIILIGFICLIAARSTVGGKLGSRAQGTPTPIGEFCLQNKASNMIALATSMSWDRERANATASVMERRVTSMSLSRRTG